MKNLFTLLFAFALTVGYSQDDPAKAEQIIRQNIAEFSKQLVAGNYDAVVDAYTEDAKIFPGRMDILAGGEAIRKYWTPPAEAKYKMIHHKIMPEEIKILGKEAYDEEDRVCLQ